MSKEFTLFDNRNLDIYSKLINFMDLLISGNNQSNKTESIFLFTIFYLQIISGFWSKYLGILDENSVIDTYLIFIEKIVRLKDLLFDNYFGYRLILVLLFITFVLMIAFSSYVLWDINNKSKYTMKMKIINIYFKIFIFVFFNITLDLILSLFCFEKVNPMFSNLTCSFYDNFHFSLMCLILLLFILFFRYFLCFFYKNNQFLSNSDYSSVISGYEIYMTSNCIIFSLLLSFIRYFGTTLFLLYNVLLSLFLLRFYFMNYPYYSKFSGMLGTMFHIIYVYSSLLFTFFYYVEIHEKGIFFLLGLVLVLLLQHNILLKSENIIKMDTPFFKIKNKSHLLFYLNHFHKKILNVDSDPKDKAELVGIMKIHVEECPNSSCISKNKERLYLPKYNQWSDRNIIETNDKVYMLYFIIIVSEYYINHNQIFPDLLMNLSLYYLKEIGNFSQAFFLFKKIKDFKLNRQEKFSFERLKLAFSKFLIENLISSKEACANLEELKCALYFNYQELSQKLYDEINNDIDLNIEFWNLVRYKKGISKILDSNKVFEIGTIYDKYS